MVEVLRGSIEPFLQIGNEITIYFWLILSLYGHSRRGESKARYIQPSTSALQHARIWIIGAGMGCILAITGVHMFATLVYAHNTSQEVPASENIQSMSLLRGSRNIQTNSPTGGGGISVIDGSLLASSGGPVGDGEMVVPEQGEISVYMVKEGDALSQIAGMFDVSVNTIAWANDLGRDRVIQPGQKLVILPVTGVRYEIKEGDTLNSIAKEFEGSRKEIQQFNDIYDDTALVVGESIIIPGGEVHVSQPTPESTPRPQQRSLPSPSYAGYYMRPVSGVRTQGLHGYNAVDIGANVGAPIVASADGVVIISRQGGWNGGYGNYIVLRHSNGTQTLYAHNSQNIVGIGTQVVQGQVIGYVGSTGYSTGPHVHFEVRGAPNPF